MPEASQEKVKAAGAAPTAVTAASAPPQVMVVFGAHGTEYLWLEVGCRVLGV